MLSPKFGFVGIDLLPESSWELPNIDEGGGPIGVKEPVDEGGGPAGVVVGFVANFEKRPPFLLLCDLVSGVDGGLEE